MVEVEKFPKLITACTLPAAEGLVIRAETAQVTEAPLEFVNESATDCPVCYQGGECELQEAAFGSGARAGRSPPVVCQYLGPVSTAERNARTKLLRRQ